MLNEGTELTKKCSKTINNCSSNVLSFSRLCDGNNHLNSVHITYSIYNLLSYH